MAAKNRILVIGSANQDLILPMQYIPAGGETITEQTYVYIPGGSGTNAALMFARLGCDCVFCSRIAKDANGRYLTDFYRKNGIDTRFVSIDEKSRTGLEIIIITDTDSNRNIIYPGANSRLSKSDTEFAMTCMPDALFFHTGLPPAPLIHAVKIAKEKGIPVFVDAGHACPDFPLESLENVCIFITNQDGIYDFTGCREFNQNTYIQVCMALANRVTADFYVIKLKNGIALSYDNTFYKLHVPPCEVEIADPATAVDTFAASLVYDFIRNNRIDRACKFANIVESITLSGAGASASVPGTEKIKRFIEENNIDFNF
jgi:ribokinase